MGNKNFLKPKINQGRKVTVSEAQASANSRIDYPVFSFKHMHPSHDLDCCSDDEKISLIEQLTKLSTMTWAEIRLLPRHGMGAEKIALSSIRPSLPTSLDLTADVEHLFAFRFQARKPFVGHLDGYIFHILFVDNKFDVYPH
jgi:hypothetical protein